MAPLSALRASTHTLLTIQCHRSRDVTSTPTPDQPWKRVLHGGEFGQTIASSWSPPAAAPLRFCLRKENRREVYFGLDFLWLACWPIRISLKRSHGFLCSPLQYADPDHEMARPCVPCGRNVIRRSRGFAISKSLSSDGFSKVCRGFCNVPT